MDFITSAEEKVLNACHRLNAEAYEQQIISSGKPIKHFIPCEKAEVLMGILRDGKHFGTAHMIAARTVCGCHASLSETELVGYESDPTYKLANYGHDHKMLYPHIWKGKAQA